MAAEPVELQHSSHSPTGPSAAAARAVKVLEQPDVRFGMWTFVGSMILLIWVGFVFPTPPSIVFLGAVLG